MRLMVDEVLTDRALNRATLERQLLLRRSNMRALDAVDHLVGMQAQVPLDPYAALWSRLEPFRADDLAQLLLHREVVRIAVMRTTIHLVTADDALLLRPLMQPILTRELERHPQFGPALRGVDLKPALRFARRLLAERPRTGPELRSAMAERFPDVDPAALAYACRNHLALVQVPPRGVWGRSSQVTTTTAEAWLGRELVAEPSIDEVVLRYLAAFGPASVADVTTWCRLSGMREVVGRLRSRLRTFRSVSGRELLDVVDAPRPDPRTPAPPRFLPEYDNVLLSHADRSRFVADPQRARLWSGSRLGRGCVLLDGSVLGPWHVERDRDTGAATLVIVYPGAIARTRAAALAAEGRRLLRFLAPDAGERDVRMEAAEP